MFEKLITYTFRKKVKKLSGEGAREKRFVSYKAAKSVLLLFESDYTEKNPEIRHIISLLQADGKKVMAWGFVDKKEVTTAILPDFRILHHKDTNFFRKPNAGFMHELEELEFDLMIDLSVKEVIPLQYLGLYAKSSFKAGLQKSQTGYMDFLLDLNAIVNQSEEQLFEIDASFIYNQIIFYLKSIQSSD
ncbi:MAG: hypothetical protein PHH37_13065 [Paludibacter sp.]|nr:hypothetical protein [Paludibacter sp.]